MKFGEFTGTVLRIDFGFSSERPTINVRIKYNDGVSMQHTSHTTRLVPDNITDSDKVLKALTVQRIGMDDLRAAFPQQLAGLNDEVLLTKLLNKTNEFVGKEVHMSIEAQTVGNVVQKNPNGVAYFNVRLRSASNLEEGAALDLARQMLKRSSRALVIATAMDEAPSNEAISHAERQLN